MSSWSETVSPSFVARHAEDDADGARATLEILEAMRERLAGLLPAVPHDVDVVIHPTAGQLALAQPLVPALRAITAAPARRYVAGWFTRRELHLLTPAALEARAGTVPGSREMLQCTAAGLYAQLACGSLNPGLGPPFGVRTTAATFRSLWLSWGAGAWLGGQTAHARPAIARRLREGGEPRFPPAARDAVVLGGTVFDLLAREEGEDAAVRLALAPPGAPRRTLEHAFRGRSLVHTSGAWRAHLARTAGAAGRP